jgi:hypothetical protein
MGTPAQYGAFTRSQRRLAARAGKVSDALSPDVPCSLPLGAVLDGDPLEFKKGSIEERVFDIILSERPPSLEKQEDTKKVLVINGWWAKRIHGGVEEHNRIDIIVENFEDPPNEWRKTFQQGGWSPRHMRSAGLFMNTVNRQLHHFGFAEVEAQKKLRELIDPFEYERYVLSGAIMFIGKSGVRYVIRKGKPTLAFRAGEVGEDGRFIPTPLAVLCMHPAGYFYQTWAGFLPPTDDVIAHLLLLRRGEHEYWKRCYQHRWDEVESGI